MAIDKSTPVFGKGIELTDDVSGLAQTAMQQQHNGRRAHEQRLSEWMKRRHRGNNIIQCIRRRTKSGGPTENGHNV